MKFDIGIIKTSRIMNLNLKMQSRVCYDFVEMIRPPTQVHCLYQFLYHTQTTILQRPKRKQFVEQVNVLYMKVYREV